MDSLRRTIKNVIYGGPLGVEMKERKKAAFSLANQGSGARDAVYAEIGKYQSAMLQKYGPVGERLDEVAALRQTAERAMQEADSRAKRARQEADDWMDRYNR